MTADSLLRSLRGTGLLVVPLALAVLYGQVGSPSDERVATNFLITVVLVLGLQTFCGNAGILSFGHISFMGVGAYVAALLAMPPLVKSTALPELPQVVADAHLGFVAAAAAGTALAGLAAALVGLLLTRMAPDAMAMATIGVLVIFYVLFEGADTITRGASGLYGIPARTSLATAFLAALGVVFLARLFRESDGGIKLRASRQDALAAAALGARVVRLRLAAWILAGALMGLGGALWAQYNLAFGPRQFFFFQSFQLLAMLVLGGMTTVSGAVMGAVVVTVTTELLRGVQDGAELGPLSIGEIPGLIPICVSVLLLLVMRRRRDGLLGHAELDERLRMRRGALRRRADPSAMADARP